MHFLLRLNLNFWNWYEKMYFLIPHSPYLKVNFFQFLEGILNTFWEPKGQKCKEQLNIWKKKFL